MENHGPVIINFERFQISVFLKDFYRFSMQPMKFRDCFRPLVQSTKLTPVLK